MLDSFFHVVVPTVPFSSFSTIMMNISSWLPYLNFRSNILSIYFPHTSWFFGMNRNLMVGAIYHRLITTTRKRADVDEDQYCGQLPTNIIIQLIIYSVFSVIQRYWKSIYKGNISSWYGYATTVVKLFKYSSHDKRVIYPSNSGNNNLCKHYNLHLVKECMRQTRLRNFLLCATLFALLTWKAIIKRPEKWTLR